MKVSNELLKRIITEERIRAVAESKLPWSKTDFFQLLSEAKWWEKLDPKSTAYQIALAAGKEWDEAQEKSQKSLSMTKEDYMKQAVYDNDKAGHKFSRWNPYEREGTLPDDDPPRSAEEIIMKGYPEEGFIPRKTTPDKELQQYLSKADMPGSANLEIETWISPFGYIHAKVPSYEKRRERFSPAGDDWVYAGEWYPNTKTGKPESMEYQKRRGSWGFPEVTRETLKLEKEAPSPDAKGMSGKDTQGQVDVQDPTMEEQLINAIREEIAAMRAEQ